MNDYTGKICPFCKTEFKPNDEIVVCSECDMPHHKDCWIENQGCTTFGCLGTIKSTDNAANSVTTQQMTFEDTAIRNTEGVVYCTICGYQNPGSSFFCARCGNRLTAPESVYMQANPENQNPYDYVNQYNYSYQQKNSPYADYGAYQNTSIEDIQPLVGERSEYYMAKFREMKANKSIASWNWAAFLVAPYWMIYRKMYGYGAGFFAAAFLISLINSAFLSFVSIAGYVAIGIFGNGIYMKFLEEKATKAKSMNEPSHSLFIAKSSGINSTATILAIIGYALLMIIISL